MFGEITFDELSSCIRLPTFNRQIKQPKIISEDLNTARANWTQRGVAGVRASQRDGCLSRPFKIAHVFRQLLSPFSLAPCFYLILKDSTHIHPQNYFHRLPGLRLDRCASRFRPENRFLIVETRLHHQRVDHLETGRDSPSHSSSIPIYTTTARNAFHRKLNVQKPVHNTIPSLPHLIHRQPLKDPQLRALRST
jgi:hypothetical protein